MSLLAQRRAYLAAYRKTGSHAEAAKAMDLPPDVHEKWLRDSDGWLYKSAFAAVEKEMKQAAASPQSGGYGAGPSPQKRGGRPRKALPAPKVAKRIGRPPKAAKIAVLAVLADEAANSANSANNSANSAKTPVEAIPEPQAVSPEVSASDPAPPLVGTTFPGEKGHVTLYTAEGEVPAPPPEPERPPRKAQEQPAEPPLDLAIATDPVQRAMIDEYGELDRRMQIRQADVQRYDLLKKAIKVWFAAIPPDADGCVEGDVYLLHLSACERERKIRDMPALIDAIGLEKVLEIATVPLGVLENMIGKTHVMALTTETRTGSRRIKAIPKRPAAVERAG